jgi:hypothetical protein
MFYKVFFKGEQMHFSSEYFTVQDLSLLTDLNHNLLYVSFMYIIPQKYTARTKTFIL